MTRIPWGGIYAIECVVNGRVYVGQTTWFERRFGQHQAMLRKNYAITRRMHEDIRAFGGEAFRIVVLERTTRPELLDRLEAEWAERLGAHGPEGYNIAPTRRRLHLPYNRALEIALFGGRARLRNAQRLAPIPTQAHK